MKRIGLIYCGGCNPVYPREEYVAAIRSAAGARIEWVPFHPGDLVPVLEVNGCERACMEREINEPEAGPRIVSLRNDRKPPDEVVSLLLKLGEEP